MLTADDFAPHIGKRFTVTGRTEELTLVSVESGRPAPNLPRTPFSLLLRGPRQAVLPEGLYELEPADGPRFELYIMPIMTPAGDRQDYQVVFN